MVVKSNADKRVSLTDKLQELVVQVTETRMQVRIPEHQRLRDPDSNAISHYTTGHKSVDDHLLRQFTYVKMTMWEMVTAHQQAGIVRFNNVDDEAKVYETLKSYIIAWADYSQANPDEPIPPMRDFIAINEYLEAMHPSYELNAFVHRRPVAKTPNRGLAGQMKPIFGNRLKDKETQHARTGFTPTRFEDLVRRFHENVWRNQQ